MTKTEIEEQALKLGAEERAELVEALTTSLLQEPLVDWQRELLDERLDEYERNPADTLSWDEVKAGLHRDPR
ncbi:MAG TPA: addiction module protein [Thermoanaerobaculia bacterium]|nr:addiction module protein [Thermoanaerobaculia bacterium]